MHQSSKSDRRVFLLNGMLVLATSSFTPKNLFAIEESSRRKIGLVTDLHYADKPAAGTRHYRETLVKLDEAAAKFEKAEITTLVELGDLIDAADSVDVEQGYLKTINKKFSAICKDRHYVLGNHCVDTLRKEEFLGSVEQEKSYYSFDRDQFHFIVLDACFRADGVPYARKNFKWTDANIPESELDWLKEDLKKTDKHVIVFAHQRLDVRNNHGVKNNAAVRQIFESSEKVLAVFQGHSHKDEVNEMNGIHYCTLTAMVEGSGAENNGYSIMELAADGTILLSGFRKQSDHKFSSK